MSRRRTWRVRRWASSQYWSKQRGMRTAHCFGRCVRGRRVILWWRARPFVPRPQWEVRVDQSRRRMADLWRRVEPAVHMAQAGLPGQILGRLIEVRFLDRTVILAAQAFSAVLPLIIVVSTISPHPGGDSPATVLARKLGLAADDVSSLQVTVAPPPP